MSTPWTSVERPRCYVKPIKRPRASPALPFLLAFLQPVTFALLSTVHEQPMKAATRKHPLSYPDGATATPVSTPLSPPPQQLESIFIDALAQSCSCRQHMRSSPTQRLVSKPGYLYHKPRRRYQDGVRQVRQLHRKMTAVRPDPPRTPLSREDYMSMLDWYRESFSTQAESPDGEPFRPASDSRTSRTTESVPKGPESRLEAEQQPIAYKFSPVPSGTLELPEPSFPMIDQDHRDDVSHVLVKLREILGKDDCTHEAAFEAYSALRHPGVSHLSTDIIRLLFRRLSTIEKKDRESKLRYLSVVDDMEVSDIPMTEAEWNSAIAFCGQCFARIRAEDVESALRTWRNMEEQAGIKSGCVTFNILFDMAAKAGKFVLAEMIWKEMNARNLSLNRYSRVAKIFYNGLRADGDGVRRAYREFVEASEIVDTVVLNCVIASLIRAGEPAAAEQIYERMKNMLARNAGQPVPHLDWRQVRDLGRVLDRAARTLKYQPVKLQRIRDEQSLTPNLRTYTIIIEHHASQTGELRRIAALLTEMQHLGIPMHSKIFLKIFKGFAFHGGIRYTSWTKARLEDVWNALLVAMEEADLKIMKWTVVWAVRAFAQCAGNDRTFEVWGELRKRWKPCDSGELQMVMSMLRDVLNVDDQR